MITIISIARLSFFAKDGFLVYLQFDFVKKKNRIQISRTLEYIQAYTGNYL